MRIMLKLSGEVLGGAHGSGLDADTLKHFAHILGTIAQKHELAIVTGGGNILRGKSTKNIDRSKADQIGMMATVINCMTLEQHLIAQGYKAHAVSSVRALATPYDIAQARQELHEGTILLVAGGTSNPYFTTDSAAALRALELNCDILIKATKVDGIYDKDPARHPDARRYEHLSFQEAIAQNLGVMDMTAMILCRENGMKLRVCSVDMLHDLDAILTDNTKSTLVD